MRVYIEDIGRHVGTAVTIKGWLHNRRSSGKIHFLILRDGSGFIQAVMSEGEVGEELFTATDHLSQETSVIVTGVVARRPPRAERVRDRRAVPRGGRQVARVSRSRRRSTASTTSSIAVTCGSEASASRRSCASGTRSSTRYATYFNDRGFILADTPIFTPAACEGTTTLFPAQYFDDQTAYLTQSGQLYNEANAMALGPRVLLRADLPRRKVEDAPASHRVLDGRAGNRLRRPRRGHGAGRRTRVSRRRARARQAPPRADRARARHRAKLERVQPPFPRITYDEAVKLLQAQGLPIRMGRRLRRSGRDGAVRSSSIGR